ncbi:polysaccharide deacetylase family protein [Myceligenerans pegani]|uniref:Polysaccharide deacetylase family protein n=1 Tax=Myceligenerans pegani TaxID=2776917 RepID=A0ABR9N331_9MICO|nr:polysaccharide deacetylase family protein [Myceligenerans sp. TRM 65318]MBE1877626.1 polysaccharide deacetylase family protein [Myceligenerans sp. TRM 65318]MBE3019897.1 polysaccharide deacetylase family protein [Myceligenerans sp. TRM 65318]
MRKAHALSAHHRNRLLAGGALAALLTVATLVTATVTCLPGTVPSDDVGDGPVPEADGASSHHVPVVHRVDTGEPVVFVTIDDGLHAGGEALDVVREHDIPVSLFLNEGPVADDASYFAEYIAMGNHVHSHTLTHQELTRLDAARQTHEICGMVDVLRDHYGDTGHVGSLLRAPYGASNEDTAAAARACGLDAIVHWSVTAEHGRLSFAAGDELRPGDIILTHFTEDLPDNLDRIRELADEEGLIIARLEDYL